MPHPKKNVPVELLETGDLAIELGVTAAAVNAMVKRGEIGPFAVTRGRGVKLFTPSAIKVLVTLRRARAAERAARRAPGARGRRAQ